MLGLTIGSIRQMLKDVTYDHVDSRNIFLEKIDYTKYTIFENIPSKANIYLKNN